MAKKVSRRMVALSMASIAAVYLAGYAITEPAAQRIASAENGDASTTNPPTATIPPTATAVKRATPVPTPKLASTGLKDGTYSATGVSRRGDVTVAVTVQSGHIAAVDITQCMTQYPESFIDGLPAQVVARQSAQVDLVSGATYSTRAFQSAVSQVLAQARASATASG